MTDLLKISEAASLGIHAMIYLVAHPGETIATGAIAARLQVSEHHLAKVMQRLVRAALVVSVRGPKGGFHLADDPATVSLLDVFEAIEGSPEPRTCLLGPERRCPSGQCFLGDLNQRVHAQIKEHFEKTKLADLGGIFRETS